MFQVAQHLASTYGDKAFKVAKMATLTGKRWPVVGRRLHEEYPYLEAEVSIRKVLSVHLSIFPKRFGFSVTLLKVRDGNS